MENLAIALLVGALSGVVGFSFGRRTAPRPKHGPRPAEFLGWSTGYLDRVCPDWRKIVGLSPRGNIDYSVPYRRWLAEQPCDYQIEIQSTWSQHEVWKSIRDFRAATAQSETRH